MNQMCDEFFGEVKMESLLLSIVLWTLSSQFLSAEGLFLRLRKVLSLCTLKFLVLESGASCHWGASVRMQCDSKELAVVSEPKKMGH